jgi:hypothetical protein
LALDRWIFHQVLDDHVCNQSIAGRVVMIVAEDEVVQIPPGGGMA